MQCFQILKSFIANDVVLCEFLHSRGFVTFKSAEHASKAIRVVRSPTDEDAPIRSDLDVSHADWDFCSLFIP